MRGITLTRCLLSFNFGWSIWYVEKQLYHQFYLNKIRWFKISYKTRWDKDNKDWIFQKIKPDPFFQKIRWGTHLLFKKCWITLNQLAADEKNCKWVPSGQKLIKVLIHWYIGIWWGPYCCNHHGYPSWNGFVENIEVF